MSEVQNNLEFENVQIGFRNLSGTEGPFNKNGDRNFVVFLEPDMAHDLADQGWNVKFPVENKDDEYKRLPYLPVGVSYEPYPPKIAVINNGVPTILSEQQVGMLDYAEIETVDLVVRPYNWTVNGQTGVKAYAKAMYVTIATDRFSAKYDI